MKFRAVLGFIHVRREWLLEKASEQGDSAIPYRVAPAGLENPGSAQVLQGPMRVPRETYNYHSHHSKRGYYLNHKRQHLRNMTCFGESERGSNASHSDETDV